MIPLKKNIIPILLCIVFACVLYILTLRSQVKKEADKAEDNKELLSEKKESKIFVDPKGREHVKEESEYINNSRNLRNDPEVRELLRYIDGKLKHIESVTSSRVTNNTTFVTNFKDSTINDTTKVKCIDWSDPWSSIKGCDGDTIKSFSVDTLNQVIYLERKKILFLRIGKLKAFAEIYNTNPHNKVHINRTIVKK